MIKIVAKPKLKNPIVLTAWPGMGEVAYRSALYLKEVMGFKLFAKLEAADFFKPTAVVIEKGIIDLPSMPAGFFYYLKGKGFPDIILFLGEAQPSLDYAEILSDAIVDFFKAYKPQLLISFAAKPSSIDHKSVPRIWMAGTQRDLLTMFKEYHVRVLREGQISGLNGIVLGVAQKKAIKAVCLLAEIPYYTVQIENPKANIAVLELLNDYFNLQLDLTPLYERSKFVEEEIDKLMSYVKGETTTPPGSHPLNEEDIEKIKKDLASFSNLPESARETIEDLFNQAASDITQASQLKQELDRWNVYKEYEDRFLDLFRRRRNDQDIH